MVILMILLVLAAALLIYGALELRAGGPRRPPASEQPWSAGSLPSHPYGIG
jgi:hypothetical protein